MEDRKARSSRRRFLSSAVAAVAALLKLSAKPATARPDSERERLARLLAEYGSELGNLRKIEGRE
jgi:hypothetical protein